MNKSGRGSDGRETVSAPGSEGPKPVNADLMGGRAGGRKKNRKKRLTKIKNLYKITYLGRLFIIGRRQ